MNGKIPSEKSLQLLIDVHEELTQIFHVISGRRNRSLASKYLHFHVPKFFFIYDSRARVGIGALNDLFDEAPKKYKGGDGEYRCFVEKCLKVQTQLKEEYKVELNPRQLDNLLLAVENTAKVVR